MIAMARKESDKDWAVRRSVVTVLLWTSVYEFSGFSHRTMWVYRRRRCWMNKMAVDMVVDNLEQQVVMVLVHIATVDSLELPDASI